MPVERRIRVGLARNASALDPDVDWFLGAVQLRAARRVIARRAAAGLAAVAVAALIIVGPQAIRALRDIGRPATAPQRSAGPRLLTGVPAGRAYVGMFLGGENLWWVGQQPQRVAAAFLHNGLSSLLPHHDGAEVDQLAAVPGGVVAHIADISSPVTYGALGRVVFIPAAHGPVRVIGRATMIAAAPSGQQIWVQTAVQRDNGGRGVPANFRSPTWAVNLAGRRVSPVLRLPFGIVGATDQGPLTQNLATGRLQLWNSATGRPVPLPVPADADFLAAGPDRLVWDSYARSAATLHVTDLRTGSDVTVPMPRNWALSSETFPPPPASFDPAGQLLALPLDRVDSSGNPSAEALFVIDLTTRRMRMIRGAQLPLPAGSGVIADTLIGSWNTRGLLWVLAMNPYTGNYQLGFWTGAGPLHTFHIAQGSPVVLTAPVSN